MKIWLQRMSLIYNYIFQTDQIFALGGNSSPQISIPCNQFDNTKLEIQSSNDMSIDQISPYSTAVQPQAFYQILEYIVSIHLLKALFCSSRL